MTLTLFNFILWDVSPELFNIGPLSVRWYGLLFALAFLIGQQLLIRIYKLEGKSERHVETLTIYMVIATIVGARLGHVLFYDFKDYLANPLEILKIWKGGLASHGATIGILIAIYLYSKKETGQSYFYVLDRLVIAIALAGCFIRLGNLMNSEIIGKPADTPTAFLFVNQAKTALLETNSRVIEDVEIKQNGEKTASFNKEINRELNLAGIDITISFKKDKITSENILPFLQDKIRDSIDRYDYGEQHVIVPPITNPIINKNSDGSYTATIKALAIPRHPSQLYEGLSSLLLFFLLLFIYSRKKGNTPEGRIFGLFLVILFTLRFLYEYGKENQVAFESDMIQTIGINMGQLLSVPFILAGIFILMRSFRKKGEIS